MNWVIRNSPKIRYHTDLQAITSPFYDELENFHWLVSDLEYLADPEADLPINRDNDFFLLSGEAFAKLVRADVQVVWGAISALPAVDIAAHFTELPYVEGNDAIWEEDAFQLPNAEIEIACWDSSYTIVKFKSERLSQKFRVEFSEAFKLSDFVRKYV